MRGAEEAAELVDVMVGVGAAVVMEMVVLGIGAVVEVVRAREVVEEVRALDEVMVVGSTGIVGLVVGNAVIVVLVVGRGVVVVVVLVVGGAVVVVVGGVGPHWSELAKRENPGRLHFHTVVKYGQLNWGERGSSATESFAAVNVEPTPIVYARVQLLTNMAETCRELKEEVNISVPDGR